MHTCAGPLEAVAEWSGQGWCTLWGESACEICMLHCESLRNFYCACMLAMAGVLGHEVSEGHHH